MNEELVRVARSARQSANLDSKRVEVKIDATNRWLMLLCIITLCHWLIGCSYNGFNDPNITWDRPLLPDYVWFDPNYQLTQDRHYRTFIRPIDAHPRMCFNRGPV